MTGHAEFNEVFLTDARARHDHIVGDVGAGWSVAVRILSHERESLDADAGDGGFMGDLDLGSRVGDLVGPKTVDEGGDPMAIAMGPPARQLLIELLDRFGRRDDPVARQRVASVITMIELARMSAGSMPPSAGKLAAVRLVRAMRDTALWLLGPGGTITGADAPLDGRVADMALMTPGMSIAGGTDEIQRNILGERHLGLPPEPRVDKDVPFRELRQGTVRA
jgi:alkylation response protein AidB-like acyl-CoA dehydrogenase